MSKTDKNTLKARSTNNVLEKPLHQPNGKFAKGQLISQHAQASGPVTVSTWRVIVQTPI